MQQVMIAFLPREFPFLFRRAFIEARLLLTPGPISTTFPFLFGGAFIEALVLTLTVLLRL